MINGNLEDSLNDSSFQGWMFVSPTGGQLQLETERPHEGKLAACLDSRKADPNAGQLFSNLMQVVDANEFRGKRVCLLAQVRTAELDGNAAAQLWMRVDLPAQGESPQFGAFDNMQDRPIRSDEWAPFQIVLDVDPLAEKIALGMFLQGRGQAWLDRVSLQEVPRDTPVTGARVEHANGDGNADRQPPRRHMDPRLMQAIAESETAPQQSFWTVWLLLPAAAILLFALSGCSARSARLIGNETQSSPPGMGPIPKFAFRFSFAYWLLYSLPSAIAQFIPIWGYQLSIPYQKMITKAVEWTARNTFQIEKELVPPNGSGDTTFNYLNVLLVFCLALAISTLWSLIDWRRTDYRILKDLLRSYLRYVLGITLLGYGLAKVAWSMNQFPTLEEMGEFQLNKTWGDSSPMNVLWSFMGASRPYTVFGGLGEIVGGVLLVFRRTTTLGALISAGVMLNVMMLNYCYDVPVKLYSTHLFVMAIYILLPNFNQFASLFVWHHPTQPLELRPPYTNQRTIWIQRVVKVALVVACFALPIWYHARSQFEYFAQRAKQSAKIESSNSNPDSASNRAEPQPRVISRGFRWINEVPFNR